MFFSFACPKERTKEKDSQIDPTAHKAYSARRFNRPAHSLNECKLIRQVHWINIVEILFGKCETQWFLIDLQRCEQIKQKFIDSFWSSYRKSCWGQLI